jgi:hypothetical protein
MAAKVCRFDAKERRSALNVRRLSVAARSRHSAQILLVAEVWREPFRRIAHVCRMAATGRRMSVQVDKNAPTVRRVAAKVCQTSGVRIAGSALRIATVVVVGKSPSGWCGGF